MSEDTLPPSMHALLERAPTDRPVALLLRHAARAPIPAGEVGNELPLTPEGFRLSEELGRRMGGRLRTVHTSPLRRCQETAAALRSASGGRFDIVPDRLLGDPGVLVEDAGWAWESYRQLGHAGILERSMSGHAPPAGFAAPGQAVRRLVSNLLAHAREPGGLHVFVTHDNVVAVTAAVCFGEPLPEPAWPLFLEGIGLWREGPGLRVRYREREAVLPWP